MRQLITYILLLFAFTASGQNITTDTNNNVLIDGSNNVYTYTAPESISWKTTETGTFTSEIKFTGNEGFYVHWGDGKSDYVHKSEDDNLSHNYYGKAGDKTITVEFICGMENVTRIDIRAANSKGNISDWAVHKFTSIERFLIDGNLFDGDLSNWDVSGMNNLKLLYINSNAFDGDLSSWDISGLNDLQRLYINSNAFDGDLSSWDISGLNSLIQIYIHNNFFAAPFVLTSDEGMSGVDFDIDDNSDIDAAEISELMIDLDAYAGTNGKLDVRGCNGGTMQYNDLTTAGKAAHDNMVDNESWVIDTD